MNKKIASALLLVIVLLAVVWVVISNARTSQSEKSKVYALLPLTGAISEEGKSIKKAMDVYMRTEKKLPFEVVYVDSESSPSKAISSLTQAIRNDKNPTVVSFALFISNSIAPVVQKQNGFTLSMGTIESEALEKLDSIQRISHGALDSTVPVAEYAAKRYKKISIIYSNEDYGFHGKEVFKKVISRNKSIAVKEFNYATDSINVREIVMKAIADNAGSIFVVGLPSTAYINIFRELRRQNYEGDILVDMAFASPFVYNTLGKDADSIITPCFDSELVSPTTQSGRDFKKFCASNNIPANFLSVQTFDTMNIIKHAFDNNIPLNRAWFLSLKKWNSVAGSLEFLDKGNCKYSCPLAVFRDGKFHALEERK